jgi:hypothetical protein
MATGCAQNAFLLDEPDSSVGAVGMAAGERAYQRLLRKGVVFVENVRTRKRSWTADVWNLQCVAPSKEIIFEQWMDADGGLLDGTFYVIQTDVFADDPGTPKESEPILGSTRAFWSRRRPVPDDGLKLDRYYEMQFKDGRLVTESAFLQKYACHRVKEMGPRGTPKKVVFLGKDGRVEILIGDSGFAESRRAYEKGGLTRTETLPAPFSKIEAKAREGGGWLIEGTLGRNVHMRHPAYFPFTLLVDRDWGIEGLTGSMLECDWGEYGYCESYDDTKRHAFFESVERLSGFDREAFMDHVRRVVAAKAASSEAKEKAGPGSPEAQER